MQSHLLKFAVAFIYVRLGKGIFLLLLLFFLCEKSNAQENYEIQVYGSETVAPKTTIVELHSNYTFSGSKVIENGVLPTNHVFHETVEITHGFTDIFEVGFYFFNAIGSHGRTGYVGSHIRPRIRIPDSWHWPVGVSLSAEVGYQKPQYSEDDWSVEIRPIVDKQLHKFYVSFNPTLEKSLHGLNSDKGFIFSPNIKASYGVLKVAALGLEYYGSVGTFFHFAPYGQQEHELFTAVDLNVSPKWEINAGYGWSLLKADHNTLFKLILGYRFE